MNRAHRNFLDARRFHRECMRLRPSQGHSGRPVVRMLQRWTMAAIAVQDAWQRQAVRP